MIGIFMLVLCVGAGVAHDDPMYACPPDSGDATIFRDMLQRDMSPTEIPSMSQAEDDLSRQSEEIQNDVGNNSNLERVLYQANFELPFKPYVRECCSHPDYGCTNVDIYIWYIFYGSNGFCFVIHPYGNNIIKYKKCTCIRCLVPDRYCATLGRCVEANYRRYLAIIYCPWTHRYYKIYLPVPTFCYCRPYCPWYHHHHHHFIASDTIAAASADDS